ncbi:MAG: ankyrin repeat domain-containing protein [Blastocatellia bacterium]|nr:ankyrin repeat domain-containing protein [Blastocatellia bacterium]
MVNFESKKSQPVPYTSEAEGIALSPKRDGVCKTPCGSLTPLMRAALTGDIDTLSLLLDEGADPNARDPDGRTALMDATFAGHTNIVAALLESKADPDAKDIDGWTALMEAASKGHTDIVKLLLSAGADARTGSKDGWTALKVAAKGHVQITQLLKDATERLEG